MIIDGYKRRILRPQFICLSIDIMKNKGIVPDEVRLMVKLINRKESENNQSTNESLNSPF